MLAAVARKMGWEPSLCDMSFSRKPFKLLEDMLLKHRPDMVGISVLTPQLSAATETAGIVRRVTPGAFLIAGGPHPTVMPEDTL